MFENVSEMSFNALPQYFKNYYGGVYLKQNRVVNLLFKYMSFLKWNICFKESVGIF